MHPSGKIPTAHIEVKDFETISPNVIMPGDPLRAKYIAENFLSNVKQFNSVRNIFGYTGLYKNKKISVMASGMGMASIGIYSYELYKFYNVENIIRIGSAGAYINELKMFDLVLANDAWSESTFAEVQSGNKDKILNSDISLNNNLKKAAKNLQIDLIEGRIHSSDVFYSENFNNYKNIRDKYNCIAVEMEAFALFANAKSTGKKAACILTITDSLVENGQTPLTIEQRQLKLNNMILISLESMLI